VPSADGRADLIARARAHGSRVAVVDAGGEHRFDVLLARSVAIAQSLRGTANWREGRPVPLLVEPDARWPAALFAIWQAGGVAVPLGLHQPGPELERLLQDLDAEVAVVSADLRCRLESHGVELVAAEPTNATNAEALPADGVRSAAALDAAAPALVVYTSGSTGGPKGVVLRHGNLEAQIDSLAAAWEWSADDRILQLLPLHHVHGIVNVVLSALSAGACCEMAGSFDAESVWERLASGEITLLMAVPTIYRRLIETWRAAPRESRGAWSRGARGLRLAVSGSAALPASLFEAWEEIAGTPPLERYGMTETGMLLSNPLHGERVPGTVGSPLPNVEVRFRDGGEPCDGGREGELEVRGPGVFSGYWRRPEVTAAAFSEDGWFRTGDQARREPGRYRLLGRRDVDIIKSGGFKISALEVEEALRSHPGIVECAVVGSADQEWGEAVSAAVIARDPALDLDEVRRWSKERLSPYKAPTRLRLVDGLPRNALGKVLKTEVRRLFDEG
jgi:malonyl-CoA/methylmalonyl-CoA synthetase